MKYLVFILLFIPQSLFTQDKILKFLALEETYYSEHVVMREALIHSGYEVEVRSATSMAASSQMIPANTTIDATANTLVGWVKCW